MRFAFFSCQEYAFGYFNPHSLLAREDVDFVVNLGDYIYAEAATQKGFSCKRRRVDTVKRRSAKALPGKRFSYRLGRGEPSLLD